MKHINGTRPARNAAIDLFRFVCATLVIAIHTNLFFDTNTTLWHITKDIVARIAVPFFFIVMGYFFITKLEEGKKPLKKDLTKIITLYLFWSLVSVVFKAIILKKRLVPLGGINYIWKAFLDLFSLQTNSVQLWFLPAAAVVLILVNFAYKKNILKYLTLFSIVCYIFAVVFLSYPEIFGDTSLNILLSKNENLIIIMRHFLGGAIPFICSSFWLINAKRKGKEFKNTRKEYIIFGLCLLLYIVENIYIMNVQHPTFHIISFSLYPLTCSIMRILLGFSSTQNKRLLKISNVTKSLADYMFYSHILFRDLAVYILQRYFHTNDFYTLSFCIALPLTITTGLLFCYFRGNKFINRFVL